MNTMSLACLAMPAFLFLTLPLVTSGLPNVGVAARRPAFKPKLVSSKGPPADVVFACSIAKDKGFCMETLNAIPESHGADLAKLASLGLQLTRSKAMEISDTLYNMLRDKKKLSRDLVEALNDCSDQFSKALEQLEDTTNDLTTNPVPFNDMRLWLATSLNNAKVCQRGVLNVNPDHLPASATLPNDFFAKLCDMSLSVITVMQIQALKTGQAATLS